MQSVQRRFAFALALAITAIAAAQSPVSTAFTYQGQLQDGVNAANGNYDFVFNLYASVISVPSLGSVSVNNVPVTDGVFTVRLDFGAAFDGNAKFLGIAVRPTGGVIYATLSPRQELTATPYSLGIRLPLSESVAAGTTAFSLTNNNRVIEGVLTAPAVGVALPGFPIAILGTTSTGNGIVGASSADFAWSIAGLAGGDSSVAVRGTHTGVGGYAGYFSSTNTSNNGTTLNALCSGTASSNVFAASHTGLGDCGVFTINNANNAANVISASTNGTGRAGEFSNSNSANGTSTLHVTTNGSNADAIEAVASGSFSNGVRGQGASAGVRGDCSTSNGSGVYGVNNSATGTGVRGDSSGGGGSGVSGYDNFGTGVYGQTSSGWGIYGSNGGSNSSGYAGFFNGRVQVQGNLSKGGGSFKIDHPLDPQNKYLYHSFVESPDMKNIYDGVVVLDASGEATVTLPDWFEALNRDFRYQLTCVGGFAPVYVSKEVENSKFSIAGGKAGLKVSWMVTGIRHDPYAEANRIPVEENKDAVERGHLLYPSAYGQPDSDSVLEAVRRARIDATPEVVRP